jgi:ABC-type lipoprotein release transport system permease subunit
MMDNVLGMRFGREQIAHKNYFELEKGKINGSKTIAINSLKGLTPQGTFRTQSTVLMASETNASPMVLSGYDLESELKFSKIGSVIPIEFRFKHSFPLILGKRLAENLGVREGSEIGVIGQGVDGSVANEIFIVEKIIDLGGGEFERNFAVTKLESMQDFLSMPREKAHILVNFDAPIPEHKIGDGLAKIKWENLLPEIASSSGFMKRFTRFFAFFFALISGLAVVNTLSLSFLERLKEYRMSTIIGAPAKWLRKSMAIEIFVVGGLSLILGNILILLVILLVSYFPLNLSLLTGGEPLQMGGMIMNQDVIIQPEAWIFLVSNGFFILVEALASFYPLKIILKKGEMPQ